MPGRIFTAMLPKPLSPADCDIDFKRSPSLYSAKLIFVHSSLNGLCALDKGAWLQSEVFTKRFASGSNELLSNGYFSQEIMSNRDKIGNMTFFMTVTVLLFLFFFQIVLMLPPHDCLFQQELR